MAILLILGSSAQAATVVVCIGLDGHVDLESVFEGCCAPSPAGAHDRGAALGATPSCGDCTDVQYTAPPVRFEPSPPPDFRSDDGSFAEPLPAAGSWIRHTDVGSRSDRSRYALAHLSSVVLLT